MKVGELTIEQLRFLIEEIIDQKFEEFFGDPDEGLELKDEIIERIKKSSAEYKAGKKGKSLEEVAKEFNFKLD